MKKLFVILTMFLLFFSSIINHNAYADFETNFDAFQIGDHDHKIATFKFLGEEKTMQVWELKQLLRDLGFSDFPKDDVGYTENVDRAFRKYVDEYERKLKTSELEYEKSHGRIE